MAVAVMFARLGEAAADLVTVAGLEVHRDRAEITHA
jgi:hypothetical protein